MSFHERTPTQHKEGNHNEISAQCLQLSSHSTSGVILWDTSRYTVAQGKNPAPSKLQVKPAKKLFKIQFCSRIQCKGTKAFSACVIHRSASHNTNCFILTGGWRQREQILNFLISELPKLVVLGWGGYDLPQEVLKTKEHIFSSCLCYMLQVAQIQLNST